MIDEINAHWAWLHERWERSSLSTIAWKHHLPCRSHTSCVCQSLRGPWGPGRCSPPRRSCAGYPSPLADGQCSKQEKNDKKLYEWCSEQTEIMFWTNRRLKNKIEVGKFSRWKLKHLTLEIRKKRLPHNSLGKNYLNSLSCYKKKFKFLRSHFWAIKLNDFPAKNLS